MASERTRNGLTIPGRLSRNLQRNFSFQSGSKHPVNAVTFDVVDLSGDQPDKVNELGLLTSLVADMSDVEVARRMKKIRDSSPTIDDALAEKIIMEAL